MLHHTVSRREFLKWSGVGLAGTLLHTGSPWGFPLAPSAPASAGPSALQINGDGVIADEQAGTYPSQVPSDARLLAGFRQIDLYQDNPALNYRLDAPTEMTLWDGRAWGS